MEVNRLTTDQLQQWYRVNRKYFYELATHYYNNDNEYYVSTVFPIIRDMKAAESKTNTKMFIGIAAVCGLFLLFIIVMAAVDKISGTNSSTKHESTVQNSEWDGSVSQCKAYLKDHLNDWDSYESIEWSPVVKADDGGFLVRNKFRAKNGFGAMVIKTAVFKMDKSGKVLDMEIF